MFPLGRPFTTIVLLTLQFHQLYGQSCYPDSGTIFTFTASEQPDVGATVLSVTGSKTLLTDPGVLQLNNAIGSITTQYDLADGWIVMARFTISEEDLPASQQVELLKSTISDGAANAGQPVYITGDRRFQFDDQPVTDVQVPLSETFHLALSHDGTTTKLLFNGELISSIDQAYVTHASFEIGDANIGQILLDDLFTAKCVLSDGEIMQIKTSTCQPACGFGGGCVGIACVCLPGFTGSPCEDVNECDADETLCGDDSGIGSCVNNDGSYSCNCAEGYTNLETDTGDSCVQDHCSGQTTCPHTDCHYYDYPDFLCKDCTSSQTKKAYYTFSSTQNTPTYATQGLGYTLEGTSNDDGPSSSRTEEPTLHLNPGSYVTFNLNSDNSAPQMLSIMLWMHSYYTAIPPNNEVIKITTTQNSIAFTVDGLLTASLRPPSNGDWFHVALVFDNLVNKRYVYLNGEKVTEEVEAADFHVTTVLIGDVENSGMTISLDNLYIGECVLTDETIRNHATDVNECLTDVCEKGWCVNTPGSYYCTQNDSVISTTILEYIGDGTTSIDHSYYKSKMHSTPSVPFVQGDSAAIPKDKYAFDVTDKTEQDHLKLSLEHKQPLYVVTIAFWFHVTLSSIKLVFGASASSGCGSSFTLNVDKKKMIQTDDDTFRPPYTLSNPDGCLTYDEGAGKITSPNYPSVYPNNADVCYIIGGATPRPISQKLKLVFNVFDLEAQYDWLDIRDGVSSGSPLIGLYSNDALPPTEFEWNGPLFMRFLSDFSNPDQGFDIDYTMFEPTYYTEGFFALSLSPTEARAYGTDGTLVWKLDMAPYEALNRSDVHIYTEHEQEADDPPPLAVVDNVRVWPHLLTDEQILLEYNRQCLYDGDSSASEFTFDTSTSDSIFEQIHPVEWIRKFGGTAIRTPKEFWVCARACAYAQNGQPCMVDMDGLTSHYAVIELQKKNMQPDCQKSFFEIYDLEGFREKFCGNTHFERVVCTNPCFVRYVADESVNKDFLQFRVFRGVNSCSACTSGSCTELYPGHKCAQCSESGDTGTILKLDFDLREGEEIGGKLKDRSGNGNDAVHPTDVRLDSYYSGVTTDQRYATFQGDRGLAVDLSALNDKKSFSLTFHLKVSDDSQLGDLISFNSADDVQNLALRVEETTIKFFVGTDILINLKDDGFTLTKTQWHYVFLSLDFDDKKLIVGADSIKKVYDLTSQQSVVLDHFSSWTHLTVGQRRCITDTLADFSIDDLIMADCAYSETNLTPTLAKSLRGVIEGALVYDGSVVKPSSEVTGDTLLTTDYERLSLSTTLPQLPPGLVYRLTLDPDNVVQPAEVKIEDGTNEPVLLTSQPYTTKSSQVKLTFTNDFVLNFDSQVIVEKVVAECVGDGCWKKQCQSEFLGIELWADMTEDSENQFLLDISTQIQSQTLGTVKVAVGGVQTKTNAPDAIHVNAAKSFAPSIDSESNRVLSLSFWFLPISSTGENTVVQITDDDSAMFSVKADLATNTFRFYFDSVNLIGTSAEIDMSVYAHYAITLEAQGHLKFYQSGKLVSLYFIDRDMLFPSPALTVTLGSTGDDFHIGQLRVYSCVLSQSIIDGVASRTYDRAGIERATGEHYTEEFLSATNNEVLRKITSESLLKLEVRAKGISCDQSGMLFIEHATGWIDLCKTGAPFEYYSTGTEIKLHYIGGVGDSLAIHVTTVGSKCEETDVSTACPAPMCINLENNQHHCLACSFDDLSTKTFISYDLSNSPSNGLDAKDTAFGNEGHLSADHTYVYYENVRGVPEFGFHITARFSLQANGMNANLLSVYDVDSQLHLSLAVVDGRMEFWMANEHGEKTEVTPVVTASAASLTPMHIGVAVTRQGVIMYDYDTLVSSTTPTTATHFRAFSRDWSRVEIGRNANGEPSSLPVEMVSVTGCVINQLELLYMFKYQPVGKTVPVTDTTTTQITEALRHKFEVELEPCHVAYVKPSRPIQLNTERLVRMDGYRLTDCSSGCATNASVAELYYASHVVPNAPPPPPVASLDIVFEKDFNECLCQLHHCISDLQCKNILDSYTCEYCQKGSRQGLLASTDYEHFGGVDYREKRTSSSVFENRYDDNGLNAVPKQTDGGLKVEFILDDSKPNYALSVHFWFSMGQFSSSDPMPLVTTQTQQLYIRVEPSGADHVVKFTLGSLGGESEAVNTDQQYEVALLLTFSGVEFYLDGILQTQVPLEEPLLVALENVELSDSATYMKDVELWKCARPEYRMQTEMQSKELTENSGTIMANDLGEEPQFGSFLHTFYINTGRDEITYELIMNNMDCSYAHFYVLEEVNSEGRNEWKDYCDSNSDILGWTNSGKLYVKYINTNPRKPTPDFFFHYETDENECADVDACEGCHNTLNSFYCADCSLDLADATGFLGLHSIFFDFENDTMDEGETQVVVNLADGAANGKLTGNARVNEWANNVLVVGGSGLRIPTGLSLKSTPVFEFSVIVMVRLKQADLIGKRSLFYSFNKYDRSNIALELHDGRPYIELRDTRNNIIVTHCAGDLPSISPSAWTLVAAVVKKLAVKLFVNTDSSTTTIVNPRPLSQDWTGAVQIGFIEEKIFHNGAYVSDGELDDFRLLNCALDDAKIEALYNSFNPGCELEVNGDSVSVPATAKMAECSLNLDAGTGNVHVITRVNNCGVDESIIIKEERDDGQFIRDMCGDDSSDTIYTTKSSKSKIQYVNSLVPGGDVLRVRLDFNECSEPHNCGEDGNCFNGPGYRHCKYCTGEFEGTLRIYYDFEDEGKVLSKALSRDYDITSQGGVFTESIFNKGLSSQITTSLDYAVADISSQFMTISFWVSGDSVGLSKQQLLNLDNKLTIDISSTKIEVVLVVDGIEFKKEVDKRSQTDRLYCALVFFDKSITLHFFNTDQYWTEEMQVPDFIEMNGVLVLGSDADEGIAIDEFKLYACALPDELLQKQMHRKYEAVVLSGVGNSIQAAPPDLEDRQLSYEARWYIDPVDTTEQIFIQFISLKPSPGGFLKIRDGTDPVDGRDDWTSVTEAKTIAFTTSATVWYFSPNPNADDTVVFDFVRDLNECNTDANKCANPSACVNEITTYRCHSDCDLDKSIILHYGFSTRHQNTVTDASGHENHAAIVNHMEIIDTASPLGAYAVIAPGQGLEIDSWKMKPVPKHTLTLALWIRLKVLEYNGVRPVFNVFDSHDTPVIGLDILHNIPSLKLSDDVKHKLPAEDASIKEGRFNLIALTLTKSHVAIYINGELKYEASGEFSWSRDWKKVQFGRKDGHLLEWLNADVDEIKLFDCQLTLQQIQLLYQQIPPTTYYCSTEMRNSSTSLEKAEDTLCTYIHDVGANNADLSAGCHLVNSNQLTWSLPEADLMSGHDAVDCRFIIEENDQYRYFIDLVWNIIDCALSTLTYQIDDLSPVDVCTNGWPDQQLQVKNMTVHYSSRDLTDSQKFQISVLRTPVCGINTQYDKENEVCNCMNGFHRINEECIDLNECCLTPCSKHAQCYNLIGSYRCECLPGFSWDGLTCQAKDPCLEKKCLDGEQCVWADKTTVEYRCLCQQGYQRIDGVCQSDEMCGSITCPMNSECNANNECQCKQGFQGERCTDDVNECVNPVCETNSQNCLNTYGSYQCPCKKGFQYNPLTKLCQDLDECLDVGCQGNTICLNTKGSFQCICKPGFTFSDKRCLDVNECSPDATNDCSPQARCTNTEGSYSCQCMPGFKGDGKSCQEIQECDSNYCSSEREKCMKEEGSFLCACSEGYFQKGDNCIEHQAEETTEGKTDEDKVWKNVDMCSAPCGREGVRVEMEVCGGNDCPVNIVECNRFACFPNKGVRKERESCVDFASMNGDSVTEDDVLKVIGWNEESVAEALQFNARYHSKVDSFWDDGTCLEVAHMRDQFQLDVSAMRAQLEHMGALKERLRGMIHCNANDHINLQLRSVYVVVSMLKSRIEDPSSIEKRISDIETTCRAVNWLSMVQTLL